MKNFIFIAALFLLSHAKSFSATWYADSTGTLTNGTYAQPWSVEYAVGKTANTLLLPGDTVIFKNGAYTCTDTNTTYLLAPILSIVQSGTPSSKITYKAESLWGFTWNGGLLITPACTNVVVRNFRFTEPAATNRNKHFNYTFPGGINDFGVGNELLHNLMDGCGHPGIGSWSETRGKYIAGNVIRFTGVNDHRVGYGGINVGSGMYLQNENNSSEAMIKGNISYGNYTTGMKAYSENGYAYQFNFVNNIGHGNFEAGIFCHQADNPNRGVTMNGNYVWQNITENNGLFVGFNSGAALGGHSNAVVINNYSVDHTAPLKIDGGWSFLTVTNNTFVHPSSKMVVYLNSPGTGGNIGSHLFNWNTYRSLFGSDCFRITNVARIFADWKSDLGGQDADSTQSTVMPTNLVVSAFRPSTDETFTHVAVVNWLTNATTTVDLSSFFSSGAVLEVFDAQAIPVAYTNFTYTGGAITLDLIRTNIAAMSGSFTNPALSWIGFDPRFRAFVVHQKTPDLTTASINAVNARVGIITLAQ